MSMANIPKEVLVQKALSNLSPDDRLIFGQSFQRKAKSTGVAYLLWFFFGLHYAYLGQWGMQLLYWLTFGGMLFWALIDLFRIPGLVDGVNRDIAVQTLHDLKVVGSSG
jgi:TM2 domain-containing membrane protein YozV